MIRSLPRLWIAMQDMLGSWELVVPTWRTMRASGRIIEHPLGPDSALYEIDDTDPIVLWVEAVDAQLGPQPLPHF